MPTTLERPAAGETIQVDVITSAIAPDGVSILEAGRRHALPVEHANRLVAAGLARRPPTRRFTATRGLLVGARLVERGEVFSTEEPVHEALIQDGFLVELAAEAAVPVPLPADPLDGRDWRTGPIIWVEATAPGPIGQVRAHATGDRIRVRECDAVEAAVMGKCRIVDRLTAAGEDYRRAFSAAVASGSTVLPSYVEYARRHRSGKPAAPPKDVGPGITVRARGRAPLPLDGRTWEPGKTFVVGEQLAAEPFMDGRLEILGTASPRFDAYVRAIGEHRAALKADRDAAVKYPSY